MSALSDRQLRRWYRDFNRRYFGGALSEEVDILYAPIEGCCADVVDAHASDFVLRVNPQYAIDTRAVRMTLLHEMAHIKLWPLRSHGARFEAEMQRLAAAGAFRGIW